MPRNTKPVAAFVALISLAIAASPPALAQVSPVAGEPLAAQLLPAEAAAQLAAKGKAISVLVEAVFSLPRAKPEGAAATAGELASIYGILKSLGSLQGIEYYSASHKAMRILYAESWIVDGPGSKTRLPDPAPPASGSLPSAETLFAFQRDLSFGANSYRYDYAVFPRAVLLRSGNLTRMSYGIVPVLAPEALAMRLLVIQADDAILFYAVSGASAPGIFKGKLEESFSNRAEALFRWFSAKFSALNK
jgi:hypothetical protein